MSDVPIPGGSSAQNALPRLPDDGGHGIAPPAVPAGTDDPKSGSASIGLIFVEMAFAVALGDAASQVAKVMKVVGESPAPIMDDLMAVAPSLAHLALTIIVIAMSWVGWYHSSATQKYMRELRPVLAAGFPWLFAFPFIMLLIDVFLVVCYFILSEGAEIPSYDAKLRTFHLIPSAKAEVDWIMAILATYLLWNVLYMLHAWWIGGEKLYGRQRGARIVAAIVSLALACGAFWKCRFVTTPAAVLCVDGALLAAVLTFRLRGVDDNGRLQRWDVVRGAAFVTVAAAMMWRAAMLG